MRSGFLAIARQPALILAEITWRWSFAAGVLAVASLAIFLYLTSLPVSWRDQMLLSSRHPLLKLAGFTHVLRGSAPRLAAGVIVTSVALFILWVCVAALARLIILRALLPAASNRSYPSLLGLAFL